MKTPWRQLLILLLCLIVPHVAAGQTSKPTTHPSVVLDDTNLGSQSLRGTDATVKPSLIGGSGVSVQTSGVLDLLRIVIALAVVIGVILALRVVVQNLGKFPGGKGAGRLVTILSRSVISPRHQVMVLQVGRRLIVVGDCGGQMNTLCEISDPDEIAELVGQSRSEPQSRLPGSFGNLFRSANEPFTDEPALNDASADETQMENVESIDGVTSEDVSGLMDKVKRLQQQFKTQNPA